MATEVAVTIEGAGLAEYQKAWLKQFQELQFKELYFAQWGGSSVITTTRPRPFLPPRLDEEVAPPTVVIDVTDVDITSGVIGDPRRCALVRALARRFDGLAVSVSGHVYVTDLDSGRSAIYESPAVIEFINTFDVYGAERTRLPVARTLSDRLTRRQRYVEGPRFCQPTTIELRRVK